MSEILQGKLDKTGAKFRDKEKAAQTDLSGPFISPCALTVSKTRPQDFRLPIGHFLRHVQQELAIFFVGFAQQAAELVEIARFFAGAAPSDIVRRSALGKVRQLRRLFTVVEELIERALESACQFLQRFDGWNSVAIFDARDVAAEKSGTLLDITL